jgi:fermentation-respiration switch protein FrsA (DUF1100 family)
MTERVVDNSGDTKQRRKARWTVKGTAGLIAFTAFIIYMIGPAVLLSDFYRSVILNPGKPVASDYANLNQSNMKCQEFFFQNSAGDHLHGILLRQPGSNKVVIYHHGNAGNLASRKEAYIAIGLAGASVFGYDYRGYGKSSGVPTLQGILDDGLAAFDFVHSQLKFAQSDIINYGESLGGGPACYVSAHRSTGGLILQSAISSLPEVGKWNFPPLRLYPSFFFPEPHMDNMELASAFRCPLAVICGGKDTTIPWQLGKHVYDRALEPKQLVILADSHHNAIESKEDLYSYIKAIKFVVFHDGMGNASPQSTSPDRHLPDKS